MLMLFVAPLVSKSLMHSADCLPQGESMHHAMHSMPEMDHEMGISALCQMSHKMSSVFMQPDHAMSPMEEIACGYCQLLVHLPFIQFALIFLLWLLLLFTCRVRPLALVCPTLFRPWNPQRARAPPSLFQI